MARLPRLNTATALTLVSLRLWVFAHLRGRPWGQRWTEGLETAGLPPPAIAAFDELLTVLAMFPDAFANVLPPCAHRVSDTAPQVLALLAGTANPGITGLPAYGTGSSATVTRIVSERRRCYCAGLASAVGEIDPGFASPSAHSETQGAGESASLH